MSEQQTETGVMVHVRFAPNGQVTEIGERPVALSAQDWFNHLSQHAGSGYQVLSGGRGIFRLSRDALESLRGGFVH